MRVKQEKKMKKRVASQVEKLHGKYSDFLWFARKTEKGEETLSLVRKKCKQIRELYPEECERLASSENGDWQNGFNSGMLAAVRLIGAIVDGEKDCTTNTEDAFPDSDT